MAKENRRKEKEKKNEKKSRRWKTLVARLYFRISSAEDIFMYFYALYCIHLKF